MASIEFILIFSGNEQAPGQASIGVEGLVNRIAKSSVFLYRVFHNQGKLFIN